MNRSYCYLVLSCEPSQAKDIAHTLLQKRLISCAKFLPVSSTYWWKDELESAEETMLVMESSEELFEQVEAEVASMHSYETFVLQMIPVSKVSSKAELWLNNELRKVDNT